MFCYLRAPLTNQVSKVSLEKRQLASGGGWGWGSGGGGSDIL